MTDVPANTAETLIGTAARPARESRWRVAARTAFPFLVLAVAWEITARSGVFPAKLFPSLVEVGAAFWRLTVSGILPHHALDTILRLLAGFTLAAVAGVAIGILMGRSRRMEDICLPLVSIMAAADQGPLRHARGGLLAMPKQSFRDLDDVDLLAQLKESREAAFKLRFQNATGQLTSHARIRQVRKEIARLETELRAREIAAAEALGGDGEENS
jgi:ribosomal protein L29